MPQYQIRLENDAYELVAFITAYKRLVYRQVLNDVGYAMLELHPNDAKVSEATVMRRLKIIRDGEIVFGGLVLREEGKMSSTAPADETWTIYALDHAWYAKRGLVIPPVGQSHDVRTGCMDDLAKEYVYYHLGAGAPSSRRFDDVSVEEEKSEAEITTESGRNVYLLTLLQKLAQKGGFDWRFVPLATGCEFRTRHPYWGLDRRKGNGVNDECVFALDRGNFTEMEYVFDVIEHVNYLYVGGQGEGALRTIVECSDADAIGMYKLREGFLDARHLQLESSLMAAGYAELKEKSPFRAVSVTPLATSWKTQWDLGDLITINAQFGCHTFTMDAQVIAITVEITPERLETVKIDLRAV